MAHVAVTGSRGFVGSHIARAFEEAGWDVTRLDRPAFDLRDAEPMQLPAIDVLVHCARSARAQENIAGSRRLFDAARAAQARSIVFVSSLASGADARSTYGKEKYAIEQLLDPTRDVVIRPGLVTGEGGLYASMSAAMRRLPIAPLIGRGDQPVYTISAPSLAAATLDIVAARGRGVYLLANPNPTTLAQLYRDVAEGAGVKARLISVPYAILLASAWLAQALHLPVPISTENVRGTRNLRRIDIPRYPEISHDH